MRERERSAAGQILPRRLKKTLTRIKMHVIAIATHC